MLKHPLRQLSAWIWDRDLGGAGRRERVLFASLRLLFAIIRDISRGQINMRAMGLVYTSLLSLIPLLAFSFSLLKTLGLHNVIQPLLIRFLRPLGPQAKHITDQLIGFVQKMNVGVLGVVGLALLIYMVISLAQKLENDLNFMWQVKRPRNLRHRITDYMSLLLVGPLMVFVAVALTAAASNASTAGHSSLGHMIYFLSKLVPYFLICGGFTFLYLFVPNTQVRFLPALEGGLLAGILWQSASWLFASFVAGSGRYNAIYSGFAIVILLLIWMYLSWLILLIGGRVAFYIQHPESLSERVITPRIGARLELELAFMAMILVGVNFRKQKPPWTPEDLAHRIRVPFEILYPVLERLISRGLLVEGGDEGRALLPGRDPGQLGVHELVRLMAEGEHHLHARHSQAPPFGLVESLLSRLDAAIGLSLSDLTLRDLIDQFGEENQKGESGDRFINIGNR